MPTTKTSRRSPLSNLRRRIPATPFNRAMQQMFSQKKALYVPVTGKSALLMSRNANCIRSRAAGFAKRNGFSVTTRIGLHPKTHKVVLGIYPR